MRGLRDRLSSEGFPSAVGEERDLVLRRKLAAREHRHLQCGSVRGVIVHQRTCHRLDDVVDVHGHAARVRPEAGVDLLGLDELVDDGGRTVQQRPDLRGPRRR